MINHLLLDTISRLAQQGTPESGDAIEKCRAYVRAKIPDLRACESYRAETRNRRIIMALNYSGQEKLGQWILKVRNAI